ncbi:MAG: adenylate kinase [Pelagibacterales bacterium]|nr:adenylate kinase [Pelagibacterales bacterium]
MINIIFLGPPGSGKGTQAADLAKFLSIPTISTGEALRREVEAQSEIGIMAKDYMNSGKLVPDDVVVNIIKNRISNSDCNNGFIVDGFPRNLSQAIVFDKMMGTLDRSVNAAINFTADDETLVKRISGRFSCKNCGAVYNSYFKPTEKTGVCDNCKSDQFQSRSDDNEVTVRERLKVYQNSAEDLIGYYEKKNLIYSVDALKSVPFIFEELKKIVQELQK